MHRRLRFAFALVAAVFAVACSESGASGPRPVPASVTVVSAPATTATVGSLAGTFAVKVTDQNGGALRGVVVTFAISRGSGRVVPVADTTSAEGIASTSFTVGTAPGANELSAAVTGIAPASTVVTGVIGATRTVTVSPRIIRLPTSTDSILLAAASRDSFSNLTGESVEWVSRDGALVAATPVRGNLAWVRVLSRPGTTYVVASSGGAVDSVRVIVQDSTSTPCTFMTAPVTLAPGGSLEFDGTIACVRANDADAEFALVAHYNTAVANISSRVQVSANGIAPGLLASRASSLVAASSGHQRDLAFELELRLREAVEIRPRVASAREWFRARYRLSTRAGGSETGIPASVRVGDVLTLNVNARDFCANPETIGARVAAITDGAIILADTMNPAGGFTDEEYRAFGIVMDTLVNPVDTSAFGAPSDIDNNGRVGILFTKAVNRLTPRGASSAVLGFYYVRDLLPRDSPFGSCPGSNASEMFYLLVPDPNATESDARTKAFVQSVTVSTIAHEYQHLINASRRMYITLAPRVDEEIWLNEGLSHIAEELVFYRASGRAPRANIDGSELGLGSATRELFDNYQRGNFSRYRQYLLEPESNSPLAADDRLGTRGATWSFLRYLVDRTGATDGDFWYRLVNSRLTGAPNVDGALAGTGMTTLDALESWSVSVIADDNPGGTNPALQQASWNFVSAMPATGVSMSYPLATGVLNDGATTTVGLRAGGSSYWRFVVSSGREALIQINGTGGAALPPGTRITVVRIK